MWRLSSLIFLILSMVGTEANANVIPFGMIRGAPMCSTGFAVGSNVNVNGIVRAYTTDGTRHFIGGDFTQVNGQNRQRFAAFDADWNLLPALDFNNSIYALEIIGTSLYAGGDFTAYGNFLSTYGAPVDSANGNVAATYPQVNGTVNVSAPDGANGWYIGGNFTTVGGVSRPYAARILANGTLDPNWLPQPNNQVFDLIVDTDRVYLSGDFTTITGVAANRLVSVDKNNGAIVSNIFNVNSSVYSITKLGANLAIGGLFSSVGTFKSTGLTRVSKSSGAYDASFLTGSGVNKVLSDTNGGYYVGGSGTYGGKAYLAHILSSGAVDSSFTANLNGTVNDLALDTSTTPATLFVGGAFTTVNSIAKFYLVALDGSSGADLNKDLRVSSTVSGLALNNTNLYVGGPFTQAGATLQRTAGAIAATADASIGAYPLVNGPVFSSIPDGAGGWYIGGSFSKITDSVSTYTRTNMARISANGTVDSNFNPTPNNSVTALLLHTDGLYIGGSFTTVGGVARGYMARVDSASGALDTSFANPAFNTTVYSIAAANAASSADVFAGGNFTTSGGISRPYLAKFSSLGILSSWNPAPNAIVYSIARGPGTKLFVAGNFSNISGVAMLRFAALDSNDGSRDASFAAGITAGTVTSMLYDPADGTLALAGGFTRPSHNGIAVYATTASSMTVSTFAPIYSSVVNAAATSSNISGLAKSGNTLYFAAGWSDVRVGQRFMAFDLTQVNSKIWESQPFDSYVRTLSVAGSKIFAGFTTLAGVNGTARLRLAAFNKNSGLLNSSFSADLGGYVVEETLQAFSPRAIEATNTRVYVGGSFTKVGATAKSYFAALSSSNGVIDAAFPVVANNRVGCLNIDGASIYMGGAFSSVTVNGTANARSFLAGFTETSGAILTAPNLTSVTLNACAIKGDGTTLYYGGAFTTMGGVRRGSLAAIDLSANAVSSWDANAGAGPVTSIAADSSNLIIGGNFSTIGGKLRNFLAGVSVSTGEALPADPTINSTVNRVFANGSDLYIGGVFTTANTIAKKYLAKLDTTSSNWDPYSAFTAKVSTGTSVNSFLVDSNILYVGYTGTVFAQSGGTTFARPALVGLNASDGSMTAFNANIVYPSGTPAVRSIRKIGSVLYLGGTFSGIGGLNINFAGAYDTATSTATNWAPNPTSTVNTVGIADSQVYVGGSFSAIGGLGRTRVAKLDISDPASVSMVPGWNPSANGVVRALSFSDDGSTVYLGGSFTQIGATSRSYLAGVVDSTAALTSWSANTSGPVYSLINVAGNIYAGGAFGFANSTARPYVAAFDPAGSLLSWNPNAGGNVYALAYASENSVIYLGGNFDTIGVADRINLGAVDLNGDVTPYTADADNDVNAILTLNGKVYVAGIFSTLRGVPRSREGATDRNGLVQAWNPSPNNTVYALGAYGADIVTTGDFTSIVGSASRVRISQTNACVAP